MYNLNLIAVVSIVAAVSLIVGMASPAAAFAQILTEQTGVNMTGGGNSTSMAGNTTESEGLPSAGETGYVIPGHITS